MNAQTQPVVVQEPAAPRFDRKFIEDHRLVERYLDNKLPFQGQRDLEKWCRAHPEYLDELKLHDRTHASLKLLEASGRPQDLGEPKAPWWQSRYLLIALSALSIASWIAFSVLLGKYVLVHNALQETRTQVDRGPMQAPVAKRDLRIAPDRAPDINSAQIAVSRASPELIDLKVDMSYARETQFRVTVDKRDQARALVLGEVTKDSNGDLRVAFNTSGLGAGPYDVRIEGLPFRGEPIPEGWLVLNVN